MTHTLPSRPTFRKYERLCSRTAIERLFGSGSRSFSSYPIRAVWRPSGRESTDAVLLISVGKRHFKHATDRNRVKRLIREAYRLNKHILTEAMAARNAAANEPLTLHVAFIWLSDRLLTAQAVEEKVRTLLHRIGEQL